MSFCKFRCHVAAALVVSLLGTAALAAPSSARAQQDEARLLFERANEHLAAGLRARGARRERALGEALDGYLGVLRLGARTRNVVFNLGLTLQELGRNEEAFNYYGEYLRTFDLSADERAEGQRRVDQLRPSIAIVSIASTPPGAAVRIDRRDLPVRGTTPLALALPPGEHTVYFELAGHSPGEARATAALASTQEVLHVLEALPIPVQVIAPPEGRLTLDGTAIVAGQSTPVAPGSHVVRLELPGVPPLERRFEVAAGGSPLVLELSGASPTGTLVALRLDHPAAVFLDGVRVGAGSRVELPVQSGPHVLRAEAPGHTPLEHAFTLGDAPLSLDVTLGARYDGGGLDAARAAFGIPAAIGVATSVALMTIAFSESERWNRELERQTESGGMSPAELHALADQVEAWSLAADVAMGVTGALALTTIVLLAIPGGSDAPSSVEVLAAPSTGGGTLVARGRFGGAL